MTIASVTPTANKFAETSIGFTMDMDVDHDEKADIIDSGGFGCVYFPNLSCDSSFESEKIGTQNNREMKISKLMSLSNATTEFDFIANLHDRLKPIPNNDKYFVVNNVSMCRPKKRSTRSLRNFNKKCKALSKHNITQKTYNRSLNKMALLNMPYAGKPLDQLYDKSFDLKMFIAHNDLLIDLLQNAILPMNAIGIYHSDIKASNVLLNTNTNANTNANQSQKMQQIKLIDWGLSVLRPKNQKQFANIPHNWDDRPFQYNSPFAVVLLPRAFSKYLESALLSSTQRSFRSFNRSGGHNLYSFNSLDLYEIIKSYLQFWIKSRGPGHLEMIADNLYCLNLIAHENSMDETVDFVALHLASLLKNINDMNPSALTSRNFTSSNETLSMMNYLNNQYTQSVDLWGFIMIYHAIFRLLHHNLSALNEAERVIHDLIGDMMINHLYVPKINNGYINSAKLLSDLEIIKTTAKKYI